MIGTEGLKTGCSVIFDARKSPDQSFWQEGQHTETRMSGQNPVRTLVSSCVKPVKPWAAELPAVVSGDTDDAKLRTASSKVSVTVGDVTEAGRGRGMGAEGWGPQEPPASQATCPQMLRRVRTCLGSAPIAGSPPGRAGGMAGPPLDSQLSPKPRPGTGALGTLPTCGGND